MKFNNIETIFEEKKSINPKAIGVGKSKEDAMKDQTKTIFKYDPDKEAPEKGSAEYKKWERNKKEFNKTKNWNRYLDSQAEARKDLDELNRQEFDKNLRNQNKQNVIDNMNSDNETYKKSIENFLHNNVSKNFNAIDADLPAFKASAEGKAIPGSEGYKQRWKHIVLSMLANKGYKQSDAQNYLNNETKKATGGMPDSVSLKQQGGVVVVSRSDYDRIRKLYPELPEAFTQSNQLVDVKYTRDKRLYDSGGAVSPLTKTSDYMLEVCGKKILVTFKEVKNQGGSQDNQVKDVMETLNTLKSNFKSNEENRAIAVIKGDLIEGKLQTDENGVVHVLTRAGKGSKKDPNKDKYLATNIWFQPLHIRAPNGTNIYIPRVMTYSKWLVFLNVLKRKAMAVR